MNTLAQRKTPLTIHQREMIATVVSKCGNFRIDSAEQYPGETTEERMRRLNRERLKEMLFPLLKEGYELVDFITIAADIAHAVDNQEAVILLEDIELLTHR